MTTTVVSSSRTAGIEYCISLERLTELNRSATPLLLSRLNSACPSFGKSAGDIDDPVELMDEIRSHCADDPEFIRQSFPLQEIVFRTLLLRDEPVMTLGAIHSELTERWSSPIRPITVTLGGLARILDSDAFYGFLALPSDEDDMGEADVIMLNAGQPGGALSLAEVVAAIAENLDDDDEDLDDDDDDLFEDSDDVEEEDDEFDDPFEEDIAEEDEE